MKKETVLAKRTSRRSEFTYIYGSGFLAALVLAGLSNADAAVNISTVTSGTVTSNTGTVAPTGYLGISVGTYAVTQQATGVAVGNNSTATGNQSIAIGSAANVGTTNVTRNGATASASQAIAIGGNTVASGTSSIAIGGDDVYSAGDIYGSTTVFNTYNTAFTSEFGYKIDGYNGTSTTADQTSITSRYRQTTASGIGSVAYGVSAWSTGYLSTAIGSKSTATGTYSTAIGTVSDATAKGATALGAGAAASADYATATGMIAKASGTQAVATGHKSVASGEAAVAIGGSSSATLDNSVALGAGSTTATSATTVSSYTIGGTTYSFAGATSVDSGDQVSVGSNGAERQIKNVAPGEISSTSTDAINGSQLYAVAEAVDAAKTEVEAGTNIASVTTATGTNGQTIYTVNANGAAVASGSDSVSVTTATDSTTNVTTYTVGLSAAAESAISQVAANTTNITALQSGFNVTTAATSEGAVAGTSVANVQAGDTVTVQAGKNISITQGGKQITVETEDDVEFDTVTTTGDVTVGGDVVATGDVSGGSISVGGNTYITSSGINANSRKITNVAAGTDATDAVNYAQLLEAKTEVAAGTNIASVTTATGTNGQTIYTVNANGAAVASGSDSVSVTTATDSTTNVTTYTVGLSSAAETALSNVTTNTTNIATNADAIEALQEGFYITTSKSDGSADGTSVANVQAGDTVTLDAGQNIAVTQDGTTISIATADDVTFTSVTSDTVSVGDTVSISSTGIDAGDTKITGVAAGTVSATSTDAINGAQLYALQESVATAVSAAKTEVAAGTNVASVTTSTGTDGQTVYTVNAKGATVASGSDSVSVSSSTDAGTNVTTYTVSLSDDAEAAIARVDTNTQNIAANTANITTNTAAINALQEGFYVTATATDGTVSGNDDVANIKAGNTLTLDAGTNIAIKQSGNTFSIATADDVTFTSVTTDTLTASGDVSANSFSVAGDTYIDSNGLNANDKKITNVAAGTISSDSTDAINGSQLYAVASQVDSNTNAINQLANEVTDVGALGAALAGLKPLQYDPMERHQVMIGFGHYRSSQAAALGFATYPKEDTMLHIGAAYAGSKHFMLNAGATWKFGRSEKAEGRPERYGDGPISSVYVLQDEMNAMMEAKAADDARIAALESEVQALKAMLTQYLAAAK